MNACGSSGLSGIYVSECGRYLIEFTESTNVKWHQDGLVLDGVYLKTEHKGRYQLLIRGDGWQHTNTAFEVVRSGRDLILTGGTAFGERFIPFRGQIDKRPEPNRGIPTTLTIDETIYDFPQLPTFPVE